MSKEEGLRWVVEEKIIEPPRKFLGIRYGGERVRRTQVADVAVKGALGWLAIIPPAGAYRLLDIELQAGILPETTGPEIYGVPCDFGLYNLLGVLPICKESGLGEFGNRIFTDIYGPGQIDSARRRLQDPTLARLIDGIAVDVGNEIRDIDEAKRHDIEIDDPLLAEPVRRIKRQVSIGTGALKTMMQERYYDNIKKQWQLEHAPQDDATRREELERETFKSLLELKYPRYPESPESV